MKATREPITISNSEFLQTIFEKAADPDLQLGVPWVLSFEGDPYQLPKEKWHGRQVNNLHADIKELKDGNNNFLVISTFDAAEYSDKMTGETKRGIKRRKSHFKGMFLVMVDDVGTKVPFERLALPPSYLLETSPDNFQAGYLLDAPCTDISLATKVLDAFVAAGLSIDGSDPGMKGVTRYGRLPVGVNAKQKYVDLLGGPFRHCLRTWEPNRRYSLDELVAGFGLTLTAAKSNEHGSKAPRQDGNEVLAALQEQGMVKGPGSESGAWEITCPWVHEHTDHLDDGTAYIEPCASYPAGGFNCFHAHCRERTIKDLKQILGVETLTECVARLAELPPLEYEQVRKGEAKRLGIDRVSYLDKAVEDARHQETAEDDSFFPLDEPWPEPVDGTALLRELVEAIEMFSVLPAGSSTVAALWVVLTYSFDCWRTLPILAIVSPEKRCGKTTFLTTLSKLCYREVPVANISSAALFRSIDAWHPTLLIDEGDSFLKDNEEMRGIINSGHTKDTAFVIRCEGDNNTPTRFSTWCPKAIAMIGMPPDTITDRSVVVSLRRKLAGEQIDHHGEEHDELFPALRSKILRWVDDHKAELILARSARLDTQNDRQADNYRPLLSIAKIAGMDNEARHAASLMIGEERVEPPIKEQLLMDIKGIFDGQRTDRLLSTDMVKHLNELDDSPWCECKHGKPLTSLTLARLLKPFNIRPKQIRVGTSSSKGYELSAFADVFARYTPSQGETPKQHNASDNLQQDTRRNTSETNRNRNSDEEGELFPFPFVSDEKSENETHNRPESLNCFGVSVHKGGAGEDILDLSEADPNGVWG